MFIPWSHDASSQPSPRLTRHRRTRQFVIALEQLEVRTPLSAGLVASLGTHDGALSPQSAPASPIALPLALAPNPSLGGDDPGAILPDVGAPRRRTRLGRWWYLSRLAFSHRSRWGRSRFLGPPPFPR